MKQRIRWTMTALVIVSCGDGGGAAPDANTLDAAGCAAGTSEVAGIAYKFGSSGGRLEGARVCIVDHPALPCETTGVGGSFVLCVPTGVDYALQTSHAGFETVIQLYAAEAAPLATENGDDAFVAPGWAAAGASYPPTTNGHLVGLVWSANVTGIPNAVVSVEPGTGIGPVYGDAMQNPDLSLAGTSSSGVFYFGELPPRTYDLTVTSMTHPRCSNLSRGSEQPGGWESSAAGATLRVPVVAGATTFVTLLCGT